MRRGFGIVLGVLLTAGGSAFADPPASTTQETLSCDVGPVTRTYAAAQWQVYSCHDDNHLLFVTAPGNPAAPDVMMLTLSGSSLQLTDIGTGDKHVAAAASAQILDMTPPQVTALIAGTREGN